MVYLLALGAALANALTSILQRMGVEDAPAGDSMKLRLITYAIRRKVWLCGFGLMVLSFVMQATALHAGRLSEVQPILTLELLFLVAILGVWFRYNIGWREWVGASGAAIGLTGFLIFADPGGGNLRPSAEEWVPVTVACAAVVVVGVVVARKGPRWWRAAIYGISAAVSYAYCAACTKQVGDFFAKDWLSIFWHWQTYGLAGSGALAVFLTQNAYHAGPIAASQSTLVLTDPLASILIGIALFGDDLRTRGAWGPLEAVSLLVLFGGGIVLSHSPLVAGMKAEGDADHELLRTRWQERHTTVGTPS
jgi:drug/metabolite transporter (DMT)-like permease